MTSEEDTVSSDEPSTSRSDEPRKKLARIVPFLLVAGIVLSVGPFVKRLPREHKVDFRFDDGANDVTRLDVDWVRLEGDVEAEVVAGGSRSFERGQAPEKVNVTVNLPNGLYALDIRVEHPDHVDAIRRRVTLGEADRIVIPLRAERARP
ncbi:MAG TPA: hypothetical protein PKA58_29925 [Polyangium sp.]|nr:hypothetical protein [Polyangium sp.]